MDARRALRTVVVFCSFQECSTPRAWSWGGGMGWAGIFTNVVVVFKKNVERCGCFQ